MIGQAERAAYLARLGRSAGISAALPVIGFFSGKGGTGKTFLAQQTAFALAGAGIPVLLVDANFQNPNLHIMNNVFADMSIGNFLQGTALFEDIVSEVIPGLYCIYGSPDEPFELRDSHYQILQSAFARYAGHYKAIILDTSAGIQEDLIRMTTTQVIVTNPEPTSVMDGYVMAKAIGQLLQVPNRLAIINRCRTVEEGKTAFVNLNSALKHFVGENIPLAGLIPQHTDIYDAIMHQQIFLKDKPESPAVRFIEQTVSEIAKTVFAPAP
ncbi:MAG: AAA family ATPase [Ignavibacteria bacterium]|nr:AAA family ATPase [Ignavibacteria bacterium]